ncbi:unnamed protein product [Spirodela intermedia]|uniref:Pseudouridine synthase RsuA/RluA-like domain-containing protein n=1 Tax=Spirodela intermedia TaxID=51605 RepID=A0A7I8JJW6_SPIIN|nr:unnamed protein product [Spirodela intermedia]CAA6670370.1 unnamed protein product [Spirodela intermedia]
MLSRSSGSCCRVLRRRVAVNVSRCYSRVSPPPPAPATVIRVSKNNLAFLGPQRKALSQGNGSNPLPGRKNFPPADEPGRAAARVTAITWAKHYFSDVPPPCKFDLGFFFSYCSPIKHNETMEPGMQIFMPVSVAEMKISRRYETIPTTTLNPNADEIEYLQRLVAYKDSAIIVLNKPPKMPVKGSLPVHNGMDVLAAAALSYGNEEGPKLVHRLDAESSGLLLMGRTRESTAWFHSLFSSVRHAKSSSEISNGAHKATVQKYWALVIGRPKEPEGVICAPLSKVLLSGGRTERVILAHPSGIDGHRDAVTEYRVLGPTINGCSWVELHPLTGLKHQLRVHCAEALGTPIVGDYKYGWCAHQRWKQMPQVDYEPVTGEAYRLRRPEGLAVQKGSVLSKVPLLHLHCREMVIPNVAKALRLGREGGPSPGGTGDLLRFVASMHSHMQISWNVMSSYLV